MEMGQVGTQYMAEHLMTKTFRESILAQEYCQWPTQVETLIQVNFSLL